MHFDYSPKYLISMKEQCLIKDIFAIFFLFFVLAPISIAYSQTPGHEKNDKLGRGMNLGNMYEAPSEGWGNPWQPEYSQIISDLGFDHVRMPVRWESRSLEVTPYTIDAKFMAEVQNAATKAINDGLYVIINLHHHEDLYESPVSQKERFLKHWEQISDQFENYSDSLVFEILNEPHGNLSAEMWNTFTEEALQVIRVKNPNRTVMIGTAEYGGIGGLSKLTLPDDDNIIVTIHYYNPFQFTHQGASWVGEDADAWLGTEWTNTDYEREAIRSEMSTIKAYEEQNGVPIHIGEFGAYEKADMESRIRWTTFLSRYIEEQGWSWAYWEFSAGFGIYDKDKKEVRQGLADALLLNEIPDPTPYFTKTIYQSDFSNSTDGWTLNLNSTAAATLTSNNNLTVDVQKITDTDWHIQIIKTGLHIENGKKYRVSVTASSPDKKSFNVGVSMNQDPWTSYGSSSSVTATSEEQTFTMIFDMLDPTDADGRIVLGMGSNTGKLIVSEVKLEKLSFEEFKEEEIVTGVEDYDQLSTEVKVYPNPVFPREEITVFANGEEIQSIEVFDELGHMLSIFQVMKVDNNTSKINIRAALPKLFFVRVVTDKGVQVRKLSGN